MDNGLDIAKQHARSVLAAKDAEIAKLQLAIEKLQADKTHIRSAFFVLYNEDIDEPELVGSSRLKGDKLVVVESFKDGVPKTIAQILEYFKTQRPDTNHDANSFSAKIKTFLDNGFEEIGRMRIKENGRLAYLYGLSTWFDEEGLLKPEYFNRYSQQTGQMEIA